MVGWEQASVYEEGASSTLKGSVGGVQLGTQIQQRFQENLKSSLSLSSQQRELHRASIDLEVPLHKITLITIEWKQGWRDYECELRIDDQIILVPYSVADNIVFDQVVDHLDT